MERRRRICAAAAAAFCAALAQAAPPADWDEQSAYRYSQAALGRAIGNHRFTDQDGNAVNLGELRGKPLVVSMIYTSCYHVCPLITAELSGAVRTARDALGEDGFRIVTVGFDAVSDTPERLRAYARGHGIDTARWPFLSGDAGTVEALAADLGFVFFASPRGFDHLAQTTIVDADGRVYVQIYGDRIPGTTLTEPLKSLLIGRPFHAFSIDALVQGIRLFCTLYDPSTGRYRFDYSLLVMFVAGATSLGAILAFVIKSWRT
jgi:protein SCO1/2